MSEALWGVEYIQCERGSGRGSVSVRFYSQMLSFEFQVIPMCHQVS